jgi:ABC-type nitrate/sulfonate/bicarbonate transport system substrate-binding protein
LIPAGSACKQYPTDKSGGPEAEEVTLSYTASTLTFLAGKVAIDQGFFRQEGLEVKFVQMRAAALMPALANGHIDYTMSFLPHRGFTSFCESRML